MKELYLLINHEATAHLPWHTVNTCYRGSDKQPRQSSRPRHTQPKQQAGKSTGIWQNNFPTLASEENWKLSTKYFPRPNIYRRCRHKVDKCQLVIVNVVNPSEDKIICPPVPSWWRGRWCGARRGRGPAGCRSWCSAPSSSCRTSYLARS